MTLAAGVRFGPYEIVAPIGAGGMGEVYRARDTELRREVAVKILPPLFSTDPDRLRRFRSEAQAAAALSHPNILSVFHVGQQDDGAPFMVTELLDGETLGERLRRGPMRLRESLEFGAAVAWGLAAAHERGIVHRDIKPANLLITKAGRVKILDFGLARLSRSLAPAADGPTAAFSEHTDAGVVMGTVGYMSPEQVRGEAADSRSDIFALGAVLYEALTGQRAFDRPTPAETMSAIVNDDPPASAETARQMPAPVARVVRRCLDKNPAKRFQSAEDLAFALEGAVEAGSSADNPIVKAHWPSRRTVAATALIVVLAALAGGEYLRRRRAQAEPALGARVEVQRLTETGTARRAAVTPDGRYVAWVNGLRGSYELRLLQIASEHDVVLLPALPLRISALHFSPDGDYLFFLRQLRTDDPASFGVFRIAALGGPATRLATDVGVDNSVTVSPDGQQIAYITRPEGDIVSIDPNGQNRQIIAKHRATDPFWYVEWSRSLERLAAVEGGNDGSMRLVTIELPSGTVRKFPRISNWAALGQPAWSDDGTRIFAPAIESGASGMRMMQVWSFDGKTGAHVPLTASTVGFGQRTLSATANGALVANTVTVDSSIWVGDGSGRFRPVSSIRGEGFDSLVWVDKQIVTANELRMIVHDLDEPEPIPLRTPSMLYRHLTRCGPGHAAYWAYSTDRQSFIARTELTTGSTTALTDGPADDSPVCTSDGSTLVFRQCSTTGTRCTWMRKSLDSGESVSLYSEDVTNNDYAEWPTMSPDGMQLLLCQKEPQKPFNWAVLIPVSGGTAKTLSIPIPVGEVGGLRWAPDGKSVLLVRQGASGVDNIWSAPLDGGPPTQITTFDSAQIFAFDVASDRRFAVARGNWMSDVVMIKNVR